VVVCRICEHAIPESLFAQHTQSCLTFYLSEDTIKSLNEQIAEVQHNLTEEYLEVPWPGLEDEAIFHCFPALHLVILFSHAISLDPSITDTLGELIFIRLIMSRFSDDLHSYLSRAVSLLHEKARTSHAMRCARWELHRTGISETRASFAITDFTFTKRISRGAFGSVFLGVKKQTGDLFAIKAISRASLSHKKHIERLFDERNILLHYSDPHIVKFYSSMVGRHNVYLVTEFVPGGDLWSLLENVGCFDEDAAKFFGREVLSALSYLRSNGIIHRDIKPDNLLVASDGHLKLTDFGLSFNGKSARHICSTGLVGTPDYVAPEIVMNKPHSFTADYWSFGAMLYEFVFSIPPFHEKSEREIFRRALRGSFEFPHDNVSPEFKDLISKLLIIEPTKRLGHASIGEIIDHPWFDGVDQTKPPFIPTLGATDDTSYFENRYSFDSDDDAPILEDLAEAPAQCAQTFDSPIESFPSIDFHELSRVNERVSGGLQSSRSSGFVPEERKSTLPIRKARVSSRVRTVTRASLDSLRRQGS
jgi:serine/threonine protein kinase